MCLYDSRLSCEYLHEDDEREDITKTPTLSDGGVGLVVHLHHAPYHSSSDCLATDLLVFSMVPENNKLILAG